MADESQSQLLAVTQGILDRLSEVTKLILEHQAYILALHAYLENQPSYNIHLWGRLLEKYRTQDLEGASFQLPAVPWDRPARTIATDTQSRHEQIRRGGSTLLLSQPFMSNGMTASSIDAQLTVTIPVTGLAGFSMADFAIIRVCIVFLVIDIV